MRRLAAVLLTVCLLCTGVFAAGSFLDGTYYGMAMGRNGWISVSVGVENGRIDRIEVDGSQETPGKLGQAMQIVEHLIGCGDLESVQAVDAVSGATMSSEGIKNAVLNALQDAIPAWLHGEDEACPGAAFADVPVYGNWAHMPIDWAVTTGVTTGTSATMFSPNVPCTRAQVVTFLWRAQGSPAVYGTQHIPFADVLADAWYAQAVCWAVQCGIVVGVDPMHFSPDAVCTRAQAVTLLCRTADKASVRGMSDFADVPPDAYYAAAAAWAAEQGVVHGVGGGRFAPDDVCTRAQIVTFLYRMHELG